MDFLFLYKATNIAKPIAASAAATVSMKKTKICTAMSWLNYEKAIKLKLTEIKSSSVHIITMMIFFRLMTIPIMPIAKIIAANDKYD